MNAKSDTTKSIQFVLLGLFLHCTFPALAAEKMTVELSGKSQSQIRQGTTKPKEEKISPSISITTIIDRNWIKPAIEASTMRYSGDSAKLQQDERADIPNQDQTNVLKSNQAMPRSLFGIGAGLSMPTGESSSLKFGANLGVSGQGGFKSDSGSLSKRPGSSEIFIEQSVFLSEGMSLSGRAGVESATFGVGGSNKTMKGSGRNLGLGLSTSVDQGVSTYILIEHSSYQIESENVVEVSGSAGISIAFD